MNSKKHKNKNRGKVNPVTTQKQQQDVPEVNKKCEDLPPAEDPEKERNEQIVQEKVEDKEYVNVATEGNLDTSKVPLSEDVIGELPVKPKRSKGKKNKYNITIESDQGNKFEIGKDFEDSQKAEDISEDKLTDSVSQEPISVHPSARKKKSKGKKQIKLTAEDVTESKSDAEISHPEDFEDSQKAEDISEDKLTDSVSQEPFSVHPSARKKKSKSKKQINLTAEDVTESKSDAEISHPEDFEDSQKTEDISENKLTDSVSQELISVHPSARKKKSKGKKQINLTAEDVTESKSDAEVSHPEDIKENIGDQSTNAIKAEVNVSSKKNKKKKRRHDSEKSDKAEEKISCTSAFKELIDVENDKNELMASADDSKENVSVNADNIDVPSTKEKLYEEDLVKCENANTQKKKKKDKKHPPKSKDESNIIEYNIDKKEAVACDIIQTIAADNTTENDNNISNEKNVEEASCVTEETQKIVLTESAPVHLIPEGNILEIPDSSLLVETDSNLFASPIDSSNKSNVLKLEESEKLIESDNLLYFKNFKTTEEAVRVEEEVSKSALEIANDDKNKGATVQFDAFQEELKTKPVKFKLTDLSEQCKEVPIFDVKVAKSASDSTGQYEDKFNTISNESDENKVEELTHKEQLSDNTPDFIHIPRSSSQQLLDNNNNKTIIQEITSNDELKLGIPVLTSSMIQGSGETPVSTPKDISTSISVTEIASIPNRDVEKTDLKSKMMEVNQDLEELKMSLEKSLAELNVVEKNDSNIMENKPSEDNSMKSEEINKQPINRFDEKDTVYKPLADRLNEIEDKFTAPDVKTLGDSEQPLVSPQNEIPPICPSRKDRKGKSKSKKKGKREPESLTAQATNVTGETSKQSQKEKKPEEKSKNSEKEGKQQASNSNENTKQQTTELQFEPIENFEDALSSSVDEVDINKTFELIANELNKEPQKDQQQKESFQVYPEINITPPMEDVEKEKQQKNINPVSQPKNLLGQYNIPVQSNKTDYKKEKNKTPNFKQAKVKIKDSVDIEVNPMLKNSKQSQTDNKSKSLSNKNEIESYSYVTNEKEEYVYKYSFRKVFLTSVCHVCRKDLKQSRVPCKFCNLVFYCNQKHKDEDWPRHQTLCFAISTIVHLKNQKHIYADLKNISGQNYRLIRMQMILSCEKVLKRKLFPWEQEALLYPRICADVQCREWKQSKLTDCEGCGQVSYCTEHPDHMPQSHQRWCKSYALYQKLVLYQQSCGRLEPKLPGIVMSDEFLIPDKINEVLASMYEEKIDMSDIQYAALTQAATAPLTTAYSYQIYRQSVKCTNGLCKTSIFTVHVVGAELQFEADSLNKWEVFLLHLKPEVKDLRVVLIGAELNPSNLPLHLLAKIKLCQNCRTNKRRVQFSFQDKITYHDYWVNDDFIVPDIVCAFNPSVQRHSMYHGSENWMSTINCVLKQKVPFVLTSYTLEELTRDLESVKSFAEVDHKVLTGPKHNPFASVRPDRNFITDDETPLFVKNYCFSVLCGA